MNISKSNICASGEKKNRVKNLYEQNLDPTGRFSGICTLIFATKAAFVRKLTIQGRAETDLSTLPNPTDQIKFFGNGNRHISALPTDSGQIRSRFKKGP